MKRKLPFLIILLISCSTLYAVDHFMMEVESGITWLHNEAYEDNTDGDHVKDPDPILYRLGLAFPIYLNDSLFLRPSLTLINRSWKFVSEYNWAMPVDLMFQDLLVMSVLIEVPIGYEFKLKSISLGFYGGLALNLRIPLWGEGESVREDLAKYFYSSFRFFNISGAVYINIPLSEKISLTLKGDTWIPVHNLWSGTELPFSDGLMVTVGAGIRFTL